MKHTRTEIDEARLARGQRAITGAVDAINRSRKTLYFTEKFARETALKGMGHMRELCFTVPEAVRRPIHVYRGVRHEREKNYTCYVAKPNDVYRYSDGKKCSPWPDKVFLVFVDDEDIVYHKRWEVTCADDPSNPKDHETRFDEQIL